MAEHIYCGSGKEKFFPDGGSVIQVSLTLNDLKAHFDAYGFTADSGKKILKLKIGKRREVGKYGETHTVEVDTWKPDSARSAAPTTTPPKDDDIPF